MKFLDTIAEKFSKEEEELEVKWEDSEEIFEERKRSEIQKAKKKAKKLLGKTDKITEQLEDNLEEIKGYKDRQDLDVVEDVAKSFYQSRKNLIADFEPSKELEEHHEDIQGFLEEFNDVSRKQGAVLKRIENDSGQLSSSLDKLLEHEEQLEQFIQDKYRAVKDLEEVSEATENIRRLKTEKQNLEEGLESSKPDSVKSEISGLENEIEQLRQSSDWRKKEELEDQLDELKQKKKDLKTEISANISKLERGLKKLVYSIENGESEFENNTEILNKLKKGEYQQLKNPVPALEEAIETIKAEELLGDRQLEKFRKGVESFSDFDQKMEELSQYKQKIEEVENQISGLQIRDEIEELNNRKENLEKELEEAEKQRERKKEQLKGIKDEIERKKKDLEETLNNSLNADVNLKD